MKPFNLEAALKGAKVVTRDGREVSEIYHFKTDSEGYPVVAVVEGTRRSYTTDGKFAYCSKEGLDLFMAPIKKEGWVNLYPPYAGDWGGFIVRTSNGVYATKEEADNAAAGNRTDCIKIEWEE